MPRQSNAAAKQPTTPLPIKPTDEEVAASFVHLSRAFHRVDDAASEHKIAKEEFKSVYESHMALGRRFEQYAIATAKATTEYLTDEPQPVTGRELTLVDLPNQDLMAAPVPSAELLAEDAEWEAAAAEG